MGSRLELHDELLKFLKNIYYQPPSNLTMVYPCIVYSKTGKIRQFSNNEIYTSEQGYQLTLIEKKPDSAMADELESYFQYCTTQQYYVSDSLYHTTLNLYY